MRAISRWTIVVVLGTAALTGCSADALSGTPATPTPNNIGAQSGQQILDTARTNAKAQASVHIKGHGTCPEVGQFGVDMKLRSDGTATGTITTGAGKAEVVTTPASLYVRGPASFWATQTSATSASAIGTKWVQFPTTSDVCIAALGSFSNVLTNYLDLPGTPTKEKSDQVYGVPAQLVTLPPDIAIWVASTGTPLPVYISSTAGQLALAMGQWGSPVTVNVPASTDVVSSTDAITK